MRIVEEQRSPRLVLTPDQRTRLEGVLTFEQLRSENSRDGIENIWLEALRRYQGIRNPQEDTDAIENQKPVEVTIGAIAVEGIYAKALELFYQLGAPLVVRPRKGRDKFAEAVQVYVDWGVNSDWEFEDAADEGILECVKLGTTFLYVPFMQTVKKTDIRKVIERGPKIIPVPIEDIYLPEGAERNIQRMKFVTMVLWLTPSDMVDRYNSAKRHGTPWDETAYKGTQPAANVSRIRQQRLDLEGDLGSPAEQGRLYQIGYTFIQYDIDDDGEDEEMEVLWDMTTHKVLHACYMQWDYRPFEYAVYQNRGHVPYGIGVEEMVGQFEELITVVKNERVTNMRLANNRIWKARQTAANALNRVWPGKVVPVNEMDDFTGERMADVYPSTFQEEMMDLAFAEKRTGLADLQAGSRLGGRTPGITAMTQMQSAASRFVPAFMNLRRAYARAVVQCLYRIQERMKAGDQGVLDDVKRVLGDNLYPEFHDGMMRNEVDLLDQVDIQIASANPSVSRESDRQNLIMLAQLWEKYAAGLMQLVQVEANPQAPPEMKELAKQLMKKSTELMRKIVRTYDQVSDPNQFLVVMDEQMGPVMADPMAAGLSGITALLGGLQQPGQEAQPQPQQNGGTPPASNVLQ